ncbi:hypothetical protein BpHYR1_040989 [Brachionus plicatilis]|uniref:Uncharacterized protein n=1 Tax=Brachionus plicatilis TaxID=10195 RepID=A0A3M7QQA3_BRAPC|nr:hypothetical protein BpHYR1_040989 [Brachionus plicatilis]
MLRYNRILAISLLRYNPLRGKKAVMSRDPLHCCLNYYIVDYHRDRKPPYLERLRQETFDLTGTSNSDFVIFGQLVHAQNGDDVLRRLEVLEYFWTPLATL